MEEIDKKVNEMREILQKRFETKILEIRKQHENALLNSSEQLKKAKDELLAELDNRLTLIKEFHSALDADVIQIRYFKNQRTIISFSGREYQPELALDEGNWKVLILAKRK